MLPIYFHYSPLYFHYSVALSIVFLIFNLNKLNSCIKSVKNISQIYVRGKFCFKVIVGAPSIPRVKKQCGVVSNLSHGLYHHIFRIKPFIALCLLKENAYVRTYRKYVFEFKQSFESLIGFTCCV